MIKTPEKPPHHPGKQLTLNKIKFETCDSLKFLYDLACEFCKPKRSVVPNTRKPRKSFRATTNRNQCDQFWDERWTKANHATDGKIKKHIATRKELLINVEVTLEEIGYDRFFTRRKIPLPLCLPRQWLVDGRNRHRKCWDAVTCVNGTHGGVRTRWFARAHHRCCRK